MDTWWERFGRWQLCDKLELLAFEAELAGFPRSLIRAVWQAIDLVGVYEGGMTESGSGEARPFSRATSGAC